MSHALLDQTNPVYNTAKLTLSILGRAGVPEAVDYAERLGFTDIRKTFAVSEDNGSELPQAILQEARYEFLNRVIRESGCRNVVDIACGFSPRGYVLAKEGYHYRGIDLEASVEALSALAAELSEDGLAGSLRYVACDLTDPDAFVKALEDIEGEVLIVCEGLMMYLKDYEGRSLFKGLYRVLSAHGGRLVSPDFEMGTIYKAVHFALLGQEEGMKVLLAFSNVTCKKADNQWDDNICARSANPEKLLNEENLSVERIAFYDPSETCRIFGQMDAEDVKRVTDALLTLKGWSVTANKAAAAQTEHTGYSGPYMADYALQGETLALALRGRVDSITSNDLLAKYTLAKECGGYSSVEIDCTDLVYISSAGLRVLMIMKKDLGSGALILRNVSAEVKEILETTGFDSIVSIR